MGVGGRWRTLEGAGGYWRVLAGVGGEGRRMPGFFFLPVQGADGFGRSGVPWLWMGCVERGGCGVSFFVSVSAGVGRVFLGWVGWMRWIRHRAECGEAGRNGWPGRSGRMGACSARKGSVRRKSPEPTDPAWPVIARYSPAGADALSVWLLHSGGRDLQLDGGSRPLIDGAALLQQSLPVALDEQVERKGLRGRT